MTLAAFPKIENPIEKTVTFIFLMGFCSTSSPALAFLTLFGASITFSVAILREAFDIYCKEDEPRRRAEAQRNAQLRAQIAAFYKQVSKPATSMTPSFDSIRNAQNNPPPNQLPRDTLAPKMPTAQPPVASLHV